MHDACVSVDTDTNKITSLRAERTKQAHNGKPISGEFMEKLLRNEQHLVDAERAFLSCHNAVSTDMDLLWSERVLLMTPIVTATLRMQNMVGQRWSGFGELCQTDSVSRCVFVFVVVVVLVVVVVVVSCRMFIEWVVALVCSKSRNHLLTFV